MSIATLSNEARIQRTLDQLGLAPSAFCKLCGIPRTRFEAGLKGEPGRSFSDVEAQRYFSHLEKLFELQVAADQLTKDKNGLVKHLPIDWTRTAEILEALVIREAQQICVEDGDHQLDRAAEVALKATRSEGGS